MTEIRTEFLFTIVIAVAAPQILGVTPLGERRNVAVTGGTFAGPRLRGLILPAAPTGSWCAATASGSST